MNIYYIDGTFVEAEKAVIPADDLAILRGFGIFDFLRTYNGVPFHLEDHLRRLQRSARLTGLHLSHSLPQLTKIVEETLAQNSHEESNIRIVVTGGHSNDGITPGKNSRLLVMVTPVKAMPNTWYTSGAKAITCTVERHMPGVKSINYMAAIQCQAEAQNRQAIEAIYLDRDGFLQEGTTSNFFAFREGTLLTPPSHRILPGITRQVVLKLAEKFFPIVERQIHRDEMRLFDEAFLTSSTKEVAPVTAIDSVVIGSGKPGKDTKRILKLFKDYTSKYRG